MCHTREETHKPLGHIRPLFFLKYGHFQIFFCNLMQIMFNRSTHELSLPKFSGCELKSELQSLPPTGFQTLPSKSRVCFRPSATAGCGRQKGARKRSPGVLRYAQPRTSAHGPGLCLCVQTCVLIVMHALPIFRR